jgi:periplasmic divalent cation tolerance protein
MPLITTAVIVLTTFPADGDVERFAATLIEERLAACVNILPPMRSVYRWKGAVEKADERQLIIKTSATRLRALKKRLPALHPYEVPELLIVVADGGGRDYLSWLSASITK